MRVNTETVKLCLWSALITVLEAAAIIVLIRVAVVPFFTN